LSKYPVVDEGLLNEIEALSPGEQGDYLFLEPHPKFPGRWYVDGIDPSFFFDFVDLIGQYRTVSPASLQKFLDFAEDLKYKVTFVEDPTEILSAYEHLNDPPAFSLNSDLPNTINGFLPFQLQGFNYLRKTERGGLAVWSTGVGKTALETALIKQHLELEDFDLALCVVKRNNKVDTLRKMETLGGIDYSYIFDRYTRDKRKEIYQLFDTALGEGKPMVGICNYEKFREDYDEIVDLVTGRNVVIFWDEMPTKLSNRDIALYQSVRDVLYVPDSRSYGRIKLDQVRPNKLRQYDLTATPIENNPVGLLNQVRLIDPTVWPTILGWEKKYVLARDPWKHKPSDFKNLSLIGLEIEHITHQVDKTDRDIAKMFPEIREDVIFVDWSPQDRKLYDKLLEIAKTASEAAKTDPDVKRLNPLQLIGVLQMICCAPSMIAHSAENRTAFEKALEEIIEDGGDENELMVSGSEAALALMDSLKKAPNDDHCNKLEELRVLLQEKYPDEKFLVYTSYSDYGFPPLTAALDKWGVSYVVYRGTDKERQGAKDLFRTDPDIQVFLSSDAGSDSIDLPEARIGVEYDQPWSHARKTQKRNRNHRVNSEHDWIIWYDLIYPDSVEERKREIIALKKGYHDGIFNGSINEMSASARMTFEDLTYILTGEREYDSL
jgi:hypothetical protein